jgi:glutamyl-tRNA reductase
MISSDQLLNYAISLIKEDRDWNSNIIQHFIETAYRVRELESKERLPTIDPVPSEIFKEYTKQMNDLRIKEPMEDYVNSIKDVVTKRVEDVLREGYQEYRNEYPDPASRAEQVLEDDSKKWAKEFLTPPTDTPMDKAEELQKRYQATRFAEELGKERKKTKKR